MRTPSPVGWRGWEILTAVCRNGLSFNPLPAVRPGERLAPVQAAHDPASICSRRSGRKRFRRRERTKPLEDRDRFDNVPDPGPSDQSNTWLTRLSSGLTMERRLLEGIVARDSGAWLAPPHRAGRFGDAGVSPAFATPALSGISDIPWLQRTWSEGSAGVMRLPPRSRVVAPESWRVRAYGPRPSGLPCTTI